MRLCGTGTAALFRLHHRGDAYDVVIIGKAAGHGELGNGRVTSANRQATCATERVKGIEPSTAGLGSQRSTTELHPRKLSTGVDDTDESVGTSSLRHAGELPMTNRSG